ncbi:TetR/AcrR family transcriptional regulator [Brevibacterium sp. JNUCC-42]|nr:TetR/AcrR family transcriptional regulator [Brevibacterium sp. JNUCC-42]
MTQQNHSISTFQMLLATTEEIIRERGCRQTTLQEIMNRTSLSKGAIYHYVQSKDELFAYILQAKMEKVNEQFQNQVEIAKCGELHDPLKSIIDGFSELLQGEKEVSSQIFIYLLSQKENKEIASLLKRFHEFSVDMQMKWIQCGQEAGAISDSVDPRKMASFFITNTYGSIIAKEMGNDLFSPDDQYRIMNELLQNKNEQSEKK